MAAPRTIDTGAMSIVEYDSQGQVPARSEWRYTTRPAWSTAGESLWMRLSKFSLFNRMCAAELGRLFTHQDGPASAAAIDLRFHARWNLAALVRVLQITEDDALEAFCSIRTTQLRPGFSQACSQLRACPACLTAGFHAAWFQWLHVERCPLHDLPLRRGCPQCGRPITYALGRSMATSPLRCTRCLGDWVPSLARPGGDCVPLPRTAAELMRNWARFARDAVGVEHHVRDLRTGQYVRRQPAPHQSARPHLLTLVNRFFDAPPPPLAELTAAASARRERTLEDASILLSDAAGRGVVYSRPNWPHFDGATSFPRLEKIVRAARSRLFARKGAEFMRSRWCKILVDDLVMPCGEAPSVVAAALGWAVSWFGSSQAISAPASDSAPALGLAAWLAHLPPRPHSVHPERWEAVERDWLLADLELSACVWQALAEFMAQQRFYILHGNAVNLPALACRRTAQVNRDLHL